MCRLWTGQHKTRWLSLQDIFMKAQEEKSEGMLVSAVYYIVAVLATTQLQLLIVENGAQYMDSAGNDSMHDKQD